MRRNNIWAACLLILASCSPVREQRTMFSQLEKSSQLEPARKIANSQKGSSSEVFSEESGLSYGNTCFKDNFTLETIKKDIALLEKKHAGGSRVEGEWRHLRLSTLPIPQANFLKTYGNSIGDLTGADGIDYSGCQDVPCIYNRIYGKDDHIAGYVHYLWFLKFGFMLSADNKVRSGKPGIYNDKKFPVSAYLYNEKELFALWRLTRMLNSPYTNLGHMVEMQRIPRGEEFESVRTERLAWEERNRIRKEQGLPPLAPDFVVACGYAYSDGFISLADGCLTVYSDWYSGHSYSAITHELAHQIDYYQGRNIYRSNYRSTQPDYYNISGHELYEYKDDSGKLVTQWRARPGRKLISSYAGTSIAENFAETLAYFRVDGHHAKSTLADDHRKFTSENYYAKKYFDPDELMKDWISENTGTLTQASFRAVSECSTSPGPNTNNYFTKNDFNIPLVPSMISCLGFKAESAAEEVMAKVKSLDPQGCQYLGVEYQKIAFLKILKPYLKSSMGKYLEELSKDQTYFAKVQSFYDQISDRTMAGNAFVSCYSDNDPEVCYGKSTIKLALAKVAPLNLPESHAEDLAQLYLGQHDFEKIKEHVETLYRAFVASHSEMIRNGASELFQSCDVVPPDDSQQPTGRHFSVGDGYMISSHYNCINLKFPQIAKELVRDLAIEGQKLQHPNEEIILMNEVRPLLQKFLLAIFKEESLNELDKIKSLIPEGAVKVRSELLSNFTWVKDVVNTEATQAECERRALMYVPLEPKFNLKTNIYKSYVGLVCKDITLSPEYSSWLENSRGDFENKAYAGLESKVLTFASYRARECVKQWPIDTNLSRVRYKKERDACLLDEWEKFEKSAIKEFESDPLVIKFKLDSSPMKLRLEDNRRRLQIKIMKENF